MIPQQTMMKDALNEARLIQFATVSFGFVSGHDFSRAVNEL